MNIRFASLFTSTTLAGAVLLSLVDAAAKGFVLLAVALLACLVLRKASAATRHLVWIAALCAALVLPVLSLSLPQWQVLPGWMSMHSPNPSRFQPPSAAPLATPISIAAAPLLDEPVATSPHPPSPILPHLPDSPTGFTLRAWMVLAVWGLGVAISLLLFARSAWAIRRLCKSSRIVCDGPLAAATIAAAQQLNVRMPVLHLGPAGVMPMVWGILRGHLLLPKEATNWDSSRLKAVLLHELAHLRRRDPLSLVIAYLARSVHWFNPLAWLAVRCLRTEQERACDDYVLRGGMKPSDYAGHVLDLATHLQPAPSAAAVALAMAERTRIEGRLHTILDAARNRHTLSRWLAAATLLVAATAALSLAILRAADEKKLDADAHLVGVYAVANDGTAERMALPQRIPGMPAGKIEVAKEPLLTPKHFDRLQVEPVSAGKFTVSAGLTDEGLKRYSDQCEKLLGRECVWVVDGVARTRSTVRHAHPGGGYGVDIDETKERTEKLQTRFDAVLAQNPKREARQPLTAVEWNPNPNSEVAQQAIGAFLNHQLSDGWLHASAITELHTAIVEKLTKQPTGKNAKEFDAFRRKMETQANWRPRELAELLHKLASLDRDLVLTAHGKESWRQAKWGAPQRPQPPPTEAQHRRASDFLLGIRFRQRAEGTFPAEALANLREQVELQLKQDSTWVYAGAAKTWLERTSRENDWTESELMAVLDAAAAWATTVLDRAQARERATELKTPKPGRKLKPEEQGLAWGPPAASGLRVAIRMEASNPMHGFAEPQILFHNNGTLAIVFATELMRQNDRWQIRNAAGAAVQPELWPAWNPAHWPPQQFRLEPGQVMEAALPIIVIGENIYEKSSTIGVGGVIPAVVGDELIAALDLDVQGLGKTKTGDVKFKVVEKGQEVPAKNAEAKPPEPKQQRAKDLFNAIQFRRNKDGTYPADALALLRQQIE